MSVESEECGLSRELVRRKACGELFAEQRTKYIIYIYIYTLFVSESKGPWACSSTVCGDKEGPWKMQSAERC
jgi:hypothetical protein